jgi:hypothetical protein
MRIRSYDELLKALAGRRQTPSNSDIAGGGMMQSAINKFEKDPRQVISPMDSLLGPMIGNYVDRRFGEGILASPVAQQYLKGAYASRSGELTPYDFIAAAGTQRHMMGTQAMLSLVQG